jgi:hypothetical protein
MKTVYHFDGKKVAVWRAHLQDEVYSDPEYGNPLLWFAQDIESRDMSVCGVKTKKEALDFVGVPQGLR